MDTFFGRYKNPLVLAIVLIAQFFLLAVQVRRPFPAATAKVDREGVRALRSGVASVVTPPESVLHKSGLSLRSVWSGYLDLVGVRRQNAALKEEVDQLRMEQAALAEDARQGQRLQDLLAFRQHYISTTVPAQVVGASGTDRSRVLYLDKGSNDGLAVDMPVITPDGIVGKIRDVYPRTSQVLEISDPTSAAGVLLEETRTRGILRGNTAGQPQIVNLMPDDRIKPGQVVLTSGGDQIFPRGLPVGVVDRVVPDAENEPMVDVVLKPAANLGRLEEVLVVTGTTPTPTEKSRRDVAKSQSVAAAAEAAKQAAAAAAALADAQRASDVLARRLPSRSDPIDPDAPDAAPDASPPTSEAAAKPMHPPSALRPDHYTPSGVPSADTLTPGQRYTPLVEGTVATERRAKAPTATEANPADAAPVGNNPAFTAAAAAMAAQRKAVADAKAAEAARREALLHPAAPAATSTAAVDPAAASAPAPQPHYVTRTNADGSTTRVLVHAAPAVQYTTRVNADGSTTRVPVPATTATAPHYITRTNADGTTTRVLVPASPPVQYTTRVNADGTTTRVPVPAPSAAAPHYITRTNADGTTTRVLAPAPSAVQYTTRVNADGTTTRVPIPAPAAAAPHYITRTNADGTTTRVLAPPAPAVQYTTRVNADGTTTRVPIPAPAAAPHYTTRTNADGTTTRVRVPAAPGPQYTTRVNADGTTTRVPIPAPAVAPHYTTRTNADGTTTRIPIAPSTLSAPTRQPTAPTSVPTKIVTDGPLPSANKPVQRPATTPKRTSPVIVPDDGSRPPAPTTTPPQERP